MKHLVAKLRRFRPPPLPGPLLLLGCFAWGLILGLFLHYVFYRVSLPLEPFIYVAF